MRSQHLSILVVVLSLVAGALALAGCGGGSSKSSAAQTGAQATAGGTQKTYSSDDDCSELSHLTTDLALADASGFDYVHAREFIDSYADRAPDEIIDSVQRLRDILDKFASAAEEAGVKPGDAPLPDQAEQIKDALDISEDDQAANGEALQTVDTWVMNGCGS